MLVVSFGERCSCLPNFLLYTFHKDALHYVFPEFFFICLTFVRIISSGVLSSCKSHKIQSASEQRCTALLALG